MKFPILLAVGLCLVGCKPEEPASHPTPTPVPIMSGATLYSKNCAVCHMEDGSGVPMMQPPLADSPVVAGDPVRLIRVLLEGPALVLDPARDSYSNTMPPFAQLTDAEVAAVLTHIRKTYGHDAPAITVEAVAAQRAKKS